MPSYRITVTLGILVGAFCLAVYPHYVSAAKAAEGKRVAIKVGTPRAWALATTAILMERNKERHDLLGGCNLDSGEGAAMKQTLADWWGINNRDDLLQSLQWIEDGGHRANFEKLGAYLASLNKEQLVELSMKLKNDEEARNQVKVVKKYYDKLGKKSLLGWDYTRYIALCRWGYLIGYLTEQEAWDRIMPAAAMLQSTFESWQDFGENYIIGRQFWSYQQTAKDGQLYKDIYRKLLKNPSSPWKLNAWNLDLR